jgi:hypothetical protein
MLNGVGVYFILIGVHFILRTIIAHIDVQKLFYKADNIKHGALVSHQRSSRFRRSSADSAYGSYEPESIRREVGVADAIPLSIQTQLTS